MSKINLHPDNPRKISETQMAQLREWMKKYGDLGGIVHNKTTGNIISGNQRSKIIDIESAQITITEEHKKADSTGTLAVGYVEYEGARFNYRLVKWTKKKEREALVIANKAGGEWDMEILSEAFNDLPLGDWGFDMNDYADEDDVTSNEEIDANSFGDEVEMKLKFNKENFDFVNETLLRLNQSKEIALLEILRSYE